MEKYENTHDFNCVLSKFYDENKEEEFLKYFCKYYLFY